MSSALAVYLGRRAADNIANHGWSPDLFSVLLGASGGPKWFVLSQLDRVLFGQFLMARRQPLTALGSSIGSWRHACLAQEDPASAIARLEQGYLHQRYDRKPTPEEVTAVSSALLDRVLGAEGADRIVQHTHLSSHIITARGLGLAGRPGGALLGFGLAGAALDNAVDRALLQRHFQRVVFHSGSIPRSDLALQGFNTAYISLDRNNVKAALMASGAIPFVLKGERDITGAPQGQYWDGGIIDYHFDLQGQQPNGLILYPHFSARVITGWFDKFLPWRRPGLKGLERLALLCPSEAFVAQLPFGKIPDRSDFTRLGHDERVNYWQICVDRSRILAEEFQAMVAGNDPLAGAVIL